MEKRLYSSDLIKQAIAARYNGSRERFAAKAGMHYHTLTKVLKEAAVNVTTLHLAARAARVPVYKLFAPLCGAESGCAAKRTRKRQAAKAAKN